MHNLSLNHPRNPRLSSKIKPYFAASSFLFLALGGLCQSSSAQNVQLRPVARLISDTRSEASHSRRRRVTIAERSSRASEAWHPTSPSLEEATSIERTAFEKTNGARIEKGIEPLSWDAELCRMARVHSQSMASQGFFAHETPEGLPLKQRARSIGITKFRVIAENIAYNKGYADPGAFAFERWMMSAGHRANILYNGFQASAIGSYVATDGSVYVTQIFISR
jgi:uncharacterized protein YkwD